MEERRGSGRGWEEEWRGGKGSLTSDVLGVDHDSSRLQALHAPCRALCSNTSQTLVKYFSNADRALVTDWPKTSVSNANQSGRICFLSQLDKADDALVKSD